MNSSPISSSNSDDLSMQLVSVRGECGKHGLWSHEVPKHMAARAAGQCPECEAPALQPIRFDMVDVAGSCERHGDWSRQAPKILADKIAGRCPHCDKEAEQAKEAEKAKTQRAATISKRASYMRKLFDGAEIPRRFRGRTFENYRAGDEGSEQHAVLERAQKFATNFPKAMELGANFVFCGKPGTGKTHLACAIGNHVIQNHGNAVLFITVFDVIQRVKATYGNPEQSERAVMQSFAEPDLLLLDEVGVQFGTDFEKVIITDIINRRYNDMRPTIILSNLSEAELSDYLGARVMDRMFEGGGGVIPFGWESYRANVAKDRDLPRGQYIQPEWMKAEEPPVSQQAGNGVE